jgi:hypothetical protein
MLDFAARKMWWRKVVNGVVCGLDQLRMKAGFHLWGEGSKIVGIPDNETCV